MLYEVITIDGADIAPVVGIFVRLDSGDAITGEIIGIELVAAHQARQYVLSEIRFTVLFARFQAFQQGIGVEQVVAHGGKRQFRIAGHGCRITSYNVCYTKLLRFQGTADAVYQNRELILRHGPAMVAVFGGDHIYRMDIRQMVRFHREREADATVSALPVPIEQVV